MRRDWILDGTHEFVGFRATACEAALFIDADWSFWSKGPVRPKWSVVVISRRDFDLHARRRGCRAPDCPVAAAGGPPVDGGDVH